ncbi:YdcF family protein [Neisseria sp. 23W00296]|uniref:YdcF family protein n=1 Tax=unclassified Neisseria TaxID=2623750 RepID=UPI0037575E08
MAKRRMRRAVCAAAGGGLLLWAAGILALDALAERAAQPVHGAPAADAAVVLGNAVNRRGRPNPCLRSRVEAGVALYHAGKARRLIMSGGTDGDGSNEAEAMRDMAAAAGVPRRDIAVENRSESTYENIAFSREMLGADKRVAIVSDAFHLPRAQWLARRHWPDKETQLYAAPDCGDSAPNYLRKLTRELLAWVKTAALHR